MDQILAHSFGGRGTWIPDSAPPGFAMLSISSYQAFHSQLHQDFHMWPRPLRLLGCLEVDPGPGSALWLCWHSYRAPASCWHGYRALAWWLGRSCFWNGAEGVLSCPGYCLSRLPGQALTKSAVFGGELPASRAGHPAGWRLGGRPWDGLAPW